jgi:hypothetical protein
MNIDGLYVPCGLEYFLTPWGSITTIISIIIAIAIYKNKIKEK